MNILIVTATYPPSANGVAISVQRFARALSDLGHTVGVVGPSAGRESDSRIRYISLPTLPSIAGVLKDYPLAIPIVSVIEKKVSSVSWDIVHVHHPSFFARAAIRVARKRSIPVVFTHHTQYETYIRHFFKFSLLRHWMYDAHVASIMREVDAIIAPSRWMRQHLRKSNEYASIHVVSSAGLTENFFTPVEKQNVSVFNQPIFLVAMRLSREKNIPLVIRAFHAWHGRTRKGSLLIIGSGEQEQALHDLVRELDIEKYVTFLGKQKNSDMPSWYRSADVLLYPSLSEVAPLTILEAMAAGLPIVAARHPAVAEFIEDGKTGILTKPNARAFTRGMVRAIASRRKLSLLATTHARAYHITRTAHTLSLLYTQIKKQKK